MSNQNKNALKTHVLSKKVAHKLITKYLGAVVILQILMPHGRKERLKIQINSSDSIFPNKPTSMISQIKRWRVYRRKSTVDPDKN